MKLYNEMAKYVDMTYKEVKDYRQEVGFIIQMFRKHKLRPKLIYDVACGAGNHSRLLMQKGYNVIGADMNPGMIRLARKQVPNLKIFRQDMRNLHMEQKADCIITMFNAINHLENHSDFEKMIKSYHKNLNKGGLVIFDTMWDPNNWIDGFYSVQKYKIENTIIAKSDRSILLSKNRGFVHQVYVVWEGKSRNAKIMETKWVNFLFDIDKMKRIISKNGFKLRIYYNFSTTERKKKNCYYVFVLEKL
ncbi:class I SAM-dependent methyltransferase [Candidatus Woesearchaeota archaeon]|nr:class I SAM-dependent methyltransferase [Candidatus Woesearchaeota archaeon]